MNLSRRTFLKGSAGAVAALALPIALTVRSKDVLHSRQHVSWSFDASDLTLSIDDFQRRFIDPAMRSLAESIEAEAYEQANRLQLSVVGRT